MHELMNLKTGHTIRIAEDIEDLNPKQYLQYLDLVMKFNSGVISAEQMKMKLLYLLCNLKFSFRFYFQKLDTRAEIWRRICQYSEMLNSFFEIEELHGFKALTPHIKSGKNLLPSWKKWHGPTDMLASMTWDEFTSVLNRLSGIQSEPDEATLEEIFKIMYHCSNPKKVPYLVKLHAYLFFLSVWEIITTQPIPINGTEVDLHILFEKTADKTTESKIGWNGILFEVARTGVFGNVQSCNTQNLYDMLLFLYQCRKQSEELQRNNQNQHGRS